MHLLSQAVQQPPQADDYSMGNAQNVIVPYPHLLVFKANFQGGFRQSPKCQRLTTTVLGPMHLLSQGALAAILAVTTTVWGPV